MLYQHWLWSSLSTWKGSSMWLKNKAPDQSVSTTTTNVSHRFQSLISTIWPRECVTFNWWSKNAHGTRNSAAKKMHKAPLSRGMSENRLASRFSLYVLGSCSKPRPSIMHAIPTSNRISGTVATAPHPIMARTSGVQVMYGNELLAQVV
jgi:hypothetical protein